MPPPALFLLVVVFFAPRSEFRAPRSVVWGWEGEEGFSIFSRKTVDRNVSIDYTFTMVFPIFFMDHTSLR